ncbi:tetraacyldisaccharide-1-P synthase [Rubrivivax sp. A210]|uniref:lipid-A-disaccharide synthase n=1 Tax=Rubrivivax sp. A210 TaxID=2772301 RepID=UPI0019C00143|nr:lipid-A-disaccharide synthase [Rubrivivax sp. A210]CAD5367274.1 tetraacyldisaccharide-1-P synthase [Rubrivivax sp. A210]
MRIAMVAGEASGDLLAGLLLGGLRQRWPGLQTVGIGGPRMAEQGFAAWWPHEKLAVRGYVEVLRHYREISAIREALAARLLQERPAAFIGVDAPDFNLGLEARLKAAGIKSVHFVCPSIWAWRGGRARKMAVSADHVLCLFPFEPELLRAHGVAASYVGHPLADAIPLEPPRAARRAALGLSESDAVVAVLPGSRRSEIQYIAPAFLQACVLLQRERPGLRFLLPVAPGLRAMLDPLIAAHAPGLAVQVLDGQSHAALAACDVTLIASGTATLEAALFKRPMVIGYRMHPLSWQLMKRMRYQPWVGLPNILSRDFVVPELIQGDCAPAPLARAVARWLDDATASAALERRFTDLHHLLKRDTARCATDALAQILQA